MKAHIQRLTSGFYAVWAKHDDGTIVLLDAASNNQLTAEKIAQKYMHEHKNLEEKRVSI